MSARFVHDQAALIGSQMGDTTIDVSGAGNVLKQRSGKDRMSKRQKSGNMIFFNGSDQGSAARPSTPGSTYNQSKLRRQLSQGSMNHRKKVISKFCRELILYCMFVALFSVVILAWRLDSTTFWLTDTMRDILIREEFDESAAPNIRKTFSDIGEYSEFWQWFEGPFVNALYQDEWYNGDPLDAEDMGYILHTNKILGTVRVRQLRVRNDSCKIIPSFQESITTCYGGYSELNEEKEPFGPNLEFTWNSTDELGEYSYYGRLGFYSGSGYAIDIPNGKANAVAVINGLKTKRWIDVSTRAVFVDFSVYNANLNKFVIVRLVTEFPETGGAIAFTTFRTVKLFRYEVTGDFVILSLELLFVLFVLYYIFVEFVELWTKGLRKYIADIWSLIEVLNLSIFVLVIGLRGYTFLKIQDVHGNLDPSNTTEYINLQYPAYLTTQESNINAVNAFLCWFKLFKYLQISKRMTQLIRTLQVCGKDVSSFLFMFAIIFLGYAFGGLLVFGGDLTGFRTFELSVYTLFNMVIGDFDSEALYDSNRIIGPLFFISFMALVYFILINMFIAIISEAYTVIHDSDADTDEEFIFDTVSALMKEKVDGIKKLIPGLKSDDVRKLKKDIKSADADGDGTVDELELQEVLDQNAKAGDIFGQRTAKEIIKAYDKDGDAHLDRSEMDHLKADIAAVGDVVAVGEEDSVDERPDLVRYVKRISNRMRDLDTRVADFETKMKDNTVALRKVNATLDKLVNMLAK